MTPLDLERWGLLTGYASTVAWAAQAIANMLGATTPKGRRWLRIADTARGFADELRADTAAHRLAQVKR